MSVVGRMSRWPRGVNDRSWTGAAVPRAECGSSGEAAAVSGGVQHDGADGQRTGQEPAAGQPVYEQVASGQRMWGDPGEGTAGAEGSSARLAFRQPVPSLDGGPVPSRCRGHPLRHSVGCSSVLRHSALFRAVDGCECLVAEDEVAGDGVVQVLGAPAEACCVPRASRRAARRLLPGVWAGLPGHGGRVAGRACPVCCSPRSRIRAGLPFAPVRDRCTALVTCSRSPSRA